MSISPTFYARGEQSTTPVLRAAFMRADSNSAKKTDGLSAFFALFGSVHVKAKCKMLVKSIISLDDLHEKKEKSEEKT